MFSLNAIGNFCGLELIMEKLNEEVDPITTKNRFLSKSSVNDFKMRNEHMINTMQKDNGDTMFDNHSIQSYEIDILRKYSLNTIREIEYFIMKSKQSLEFFKDYQKLDLVNDFKYLSVSKTVEKGRPIVKKIGELDVRIDKQYILSSVGAEIANLEAIYIKMKIKEFKEKFKVAVLK